MNSLFVVKCIRGITKAKVLKLESKTYMSLNTENAAYSYEMAIFHLVSNHKKNPYEKIGFSGPVLTNSDPPVYISSGSRISGCYICPRLGVRTK